MNRIMQARIALALIGVLIWGYGTSVDDANLRLVGIVLLFLSLVMRFFQRRRVSDSQAADDRE